MPYEDESVRMQRLTKLANVRLNRLMDAGMYFWLRDGQSQKNQRVRLSRLTRHDAIRASRRGSLKVPLKRR